MDRISYEIYINLDKEELLVGNLIYDIADSLCTFQYSPAYLKHTKAFAIQPSLELKEEIYQCPKGHIFGCFHDSLPGKWGHYLLRSQGKLPLEIEQLALVKDTVRQGALRVKLSCDSSFLSKGLLPILKKEELPKIVHTFRRFATGKTSKKDLIRLQEEGVSLGGIDHKVSFTDKSGQLYIAKLPHHEEGLSARRWEALALTISQRAALDTVEWEFLEIDSTPIVVSKRFDRLNNERVPYISGKTFMNIYHDRGDSYFTTLKLLDSFGSQPQKDKREIWKRVVLKALISVYDDNFKNFGFLLDKQKWRLTPLYDYIPIPEAVKSRDPEFSLESAMLDLEVFGINEQEAVSDIKKIYETVLSWRDIAKELNISEKEQEIMSSAFEHQDTLFAKSL
ncbi:MAG: hypothetical protein GWP59_07910 [Chlamydiales bacterium]|nr:type II toxin-antitoxin system HipA family toxin [Chlamydiales bacterium]NCF71610.1 hypothetical protein [Chlamydiales bacterium]